jgi:hypothetical protein
MKRQTRSDEPRWQRTLYRPDTLADDLGIIGASVGPRTGPHKRTKGEKEDYVLRRLLAAWKISGRLKFPVDIQAEQSVPLEPDFVLMLANGDSLGVEITEAGEERYQQWLTHAEPEIRSGKVVHIPFEADTRRTASEISRAIAAKVKKFDAGSYRQSPCHLVVYDNTSWGGFLNKSELVDLVRHHNGLVGRFVEVHLVFNQRVFLDVFGRAELLDVSESYEIDVPRWASAQARRLRESADGWVGLDRHNIAGELDDLGKSERRALASQVRNLLIHLLKYEFKPTKRSASWRLSIDNARAELDEILSESPSLGADLALTIERQYRRARAGVAVQTKLAVATFPETCPYSRKQLLDEAYLPGAKK